MRHSARTEGRTYRRGDGDAEYNRLMEERKTYEESISPPEEAPKKVAPSRKVTVRRVEPKPNQDKGSLKDLPTEEPTEVQKWLSQTPKRTAPKSEGTGFIPRHLRDATRGPDGKLRTAVDHKGRTWRS